MNWKTIDKLEARVPGAQTYRGETVEFDVRLGRAGTPLHLTGKESERFRIENKELDITVEAATLHEAKQLLREKLAASEDFTGTWKLWMQIDVEGGYNPDAFQGEAGQCKIATKFVVELTTNKRKRHMRIDGNLPQPFVGDYWRPKTHNELSQLREGGALESRSDKSEVWIEATPELVETIRVLQRKLGASGDRVTEALSKSRFLATLQSVRAGANLLGTSIIDGET